MGKVTWKPCRREGRPPATLPQFLSCPPGTYTRGLARGPYPPLEAELAAPSLLQRPPDSHFSVLHPVCPLSGVPGTLDRAHPGHLHLHDPVSKYGEI